MSADTVSELSGQAVLRAAADTAPLLGGCPPAPVNEGASNDIPGDEPRAHQTDEAGAEGVQVVETSALHEPPAESTTYDRAVTPLSRTVTDGARRQELGTDGRDDVARCVRDARARLTSTSPAMNALDVGARSVQLQAALAPVREAIYRATCEDLGVSPDGPERPTEALRITARNLATLDILAETFWTWIETRGVLTAKGKTRSAVTTLLSIIDRQTKLAAIIGLNRRAHDIGRMPIQQFLEHQRRHQTNEGEHP